MRGRPPKYNPEHHPQELIKLMSRGYTNSQIFGDWEISKETFYCWIREHPEFKAAYEVGLPLCEAWWEKKGMEFMEDSNNKAFNYWVAFMNNKFGWSKGAGQVDNQPNQTINIGNINVLQSQSHDQLLEHVMDKLKECNVIDILPESIEILNDQLKLSESKDQE